MRVRWRPWRDPWWGVGVVLLAGAYAWTGIRTTTFLPDEELYIALARWVPPHLPDSLFALAPYQCGLQRLDVLALALPFGVSGLPVSFGVGHAAQALLFVSTALPVALLGERLGLGRVGCLVVALGCVAIPAGIVASSFLPEAAAYPAFAWALWGTSLAVVEPSGRHDLLALALCALAALTRTQLAVLLALPLAAVLVTSLIDRASPAAALARAWREHRVLTAVTGAAAIAVLLAGALSGRAYGTLLGSYATSAGSASSNQARDFALDLVHLCAEVAFLPAALAVAWLLARRMRDPNRGAFRVVALIAAALLVASLVGAARDERYLLYFVPIVLLAAALYVQERRAWAPAAVAGLAIAALAASVTWSADAGRYERLVFPAQTFLRGAVIDPLGAPGLGLVVAVVVLAGAACLLGTHRARRVVALAAVLAYAGLALVATLVGFGDGLGDFDGPSANARGWVDAHAGSAAVGALAVGPGGERAFAPRWRTAIYWNGSITRWLWLGPTAPTLPVGNARLPVDVSGSRLAVSAAGRLSAPGGVPANLVVPAAQVTVGLEARVLSRSRIADAELVRLSQPPRLRFLVTGAGPRGLISAGAPVSVQAFAGADVCVRVRSSAAGAALAVSSGGLTRSVALRALRVTRVSLRAARSGLALTSRARVASSVAIVGVTAAACPAERRRGARPDRRQAHSGAHLP